MASTNVDQDIWTDVEEENDYDDWNADDDEEGLVDNEDQVSSSATHSLDEEDDSRSPEDTAMLNAARATLTSYYQPLSDKANRQLRRAENTFLAASDTSVASMGEAEALRELQVAIEVAQYYRHALIDIEYAYNTRDLRYHKSLWETEVVVEVS